MKPKTFFFLLVVCMLAVMLIDYFCLRENLAGQLLLPVIGHQDIHLCKMREVCIGFAIYCLANGLTLLYGKLVPQSKKAGACGLAVKFIVGAFDLIVAVFFVAMLLIQFTAHSTTAAL